MRSARRATTASTKTTFIQRLAEGGKHYFLSRPRRFGKSLLLDTIKELFEGREMLFRGLSIHGRWDWMPRPVLRLDFGAGNFEEPDCAKKWQHNAAQDGGGHGRQPLAHREVPWPSSSASRFRKKPGPVTLSAHDADDLHRTNVRTKRDERWSDGPERIRQRSDVLSGVSRIGMLGEKPEGAVKRFEHFIRNVEAEPLRCVVPDAVRIGLGERGEDVAPAHSDARRLFAAARFLARATASSPSTSSPRSACAMASSTRARIAGSRALPSSSS